ncbi:MAG: hypothetical protein QM793_10280 [Muricomes sp.]
MDQKNLQAEMISLFQETAGYSGKFHKKSYESDMDLLKSKHSELMEEIKNAIEESDERLEEIASYVPDYVAKQLEQVSSKRKRDLAALDNNMNMVSYFVPLMGEIFSERAKIFTEKLVELWNKNMPDNKIGHSTRQNIQGGFKKGLFCYITTAVCKSMDKPDDCYELTVLRDYRDEYLLNSKEGEGLVKEYYNVAPTIVKRIDREASSAEIYAGIWQDYLSPCIRLIEADRKEECRELYGDMVHSLEKRYLYS